MKIKKAKEDAMTKCKDREPRTTHLQEKLDILADEFLRKHGYARDGRKRGTASRYDMMHKAVLCPIGSGKRQ
jgi:hypothetical protein